MGRKFVPDCNRSSGDRNAWNRPTPSTAARWLAGGASPIVVTLSSLWLWAALWAAIASMSSGAMR